MHQLPQCSSTHSRPSRVQVILQHTGQTYERLSLERWFNTCARRDPPRYTCPITGVVLSEITTVRNGVVLSEVTTVRNWALKAAVECWKESYTVSPPDAAAQAPTLQNLRHLLNTALTVCMSGIRTINVARLELPQLDPVDLPPPRGSTAAAQSHQRYLSTVGVLQVRYHWVFPSSSLVLLAHTHPVAGPEMALLTDDLPYPLSPAQ